jgi:quercetin dioxygenase-like cupin family protein
MKIISSLGLLSFGLAAAAFATEEPAKLGSTFFTWESRVAKPTEVGERREVAKNPTATLKELECHISTLNPDRASHPPHTHPQEELIILRDGTLDVQVNGAVTRVGPGSLFFFAANDPHAVQNHGDQPATYFVFNFSTAVTATLKGQAAQPAGPGRLGSTIFHWDKLTAEPMKFGARRQVTDRPTLTLAGLECHVTTLNPGEASGKPHNHAEELVLLVKEGRVDVTVNGKSEQLGGGSICFIATGDVLGVTNPGSSPATYYIIRLKTEATPVAGS